jgi:hypothetical protein
VRKGGLATWRRDLASGQRVGASAEQEPEVTSQNRCARGGGGTRAMAARVRMTSPKEIAVTGGRFRSRFNLTMRTERCFKVSTGSEGQNGF